jgi:hypothetical protein
MTPDQLAERIMDRIQKDQAIHKSSIVEELQLACMPTVKTMAQRDGYPVEASDFGNAIGLHAINANFEKFVPDQSTRHRQMRLTAEDRSELRKFLEALDQ